MTRLPGAELGAAVRTDRVATLVRDRVLGCVDADLVVLFGSAAHGRARADSDLDLLVVVDCRGQAREVARELSRQLSGLAMPVDVHVVAPAEFTCRTQYAEFVRSVRRDGQVLHGALPAAEV